jgi:Ser/Thr protein kinase RdoA (MazF antagonist)
VAASKSRPQWHALPAQVQVEVQRLAGGPVVAAQNCPGGFSPGLASRLSLTDGRRVFVKAMDADSWPDEAMPHRAEAAIAAALPETTPAPRLLGTLDDGHWVVLVFEDIDGAAPPQPWHSADLHRVVAALNQMTRAVTPSPIPLPSEHPRLGGWTELASDSSCLAQLPAQSAWAAEHLDLLIRLEQDGLAAAQGDTLVHFDVYPHNILLTPERVVFVDWPHARLGDPTIDLILLLSSAAADGIDPEPLLADKTASEQASIDAILAAHAGFLLVGGLSVVPPGLAAIPQAKRYLGRGALRWLQRRLGR